MKGSHGTLRAPRDHWLSRTNIPDPLSQPPVTTKREVSSIGLTSEREREKLREDVERIGTRFDVNKRAGSNQCPTFGTDLPDKDKDDAGRVPEDAMKARTAQKPSTGDHVVIRDARSDCPADFMDVTDTHYLAILVGRTTMPSASAALRSPLFSVTNGNPRRMARSRYAAS